MSCCIFLPVCLVERNGTGYRNIQGADDADLRDYEISVGHIPDFLADAIMFIAKYQGYRLGEIDLVQ